MYRDHDTWMMKKIFHLSDRSLIRMVNRLFGTEYGDSEYVRKEWGHAGSIRVCLMIGCANRYEFEMRRLGVCLQIRAEDLGCRFHYEDAASRSELRIAEPGPVSFGENTKEEYCTVLEFLGNERIVLSVYDITVSDRSAWKLEETGLILFLPFLAYCFTAETESPEQRQESLKTFVIRDIVGALHVSMKKGELTVFDVQRLKKYCRLMLFRVLSRERWMQDLELQELLLNCLDADIDLLEHLYRRKAVKERRALLDVHRGRTENQMR